MKKYGVSGIIYGIIYKEVCMFKLIGYLGNYKKESILAPVFKLVEVAFELAVPLVIADVIDRGIAAGDKSFIINRCILLGMFALFGLGCTIAAQYFAAKAAVGSTTDLRRDLFSHIGKLSFSQLDSFGAPTLLTRLTGDINPDTDRYKPHAASCPALSVCRFRRCHHGVYR